MKRSWTVQGTHADMGKEQANLTQHREAPDTPEFDPRTCLLWELVISISSLEIDSGVFEWEYGSVVFSDFCPAY